MNTFEIAANTILLNNASYAKVTNIEPMRSRLYIIELAAIEQVNNHRLTYIPVKIYNSLYQNTNIILEAFADKDILLQEWYPKLKEDLDAISINRTI